MENCLEQSVVIQGVRRQHPAQPGRAAAAQEVHQHGLGLIVGVVTHRKRGRAAGLGDLGQEAIAGLPRSLFERKAGLTRQRGHIGPADGAGQPPAVGQLRHERGIGVGLSAAQAVVEMRDVEPQPQLRRQPAEQVEQAQRVRPARHADDDRLTGGEQAIPLCVLSNARQEIVHRGGSYHVADESSKSLKDPIYSAIGRYRSKT